MSDGKNVILCNFAIETCILYKRQIKVEQQFLSERVLDVLSFPWSDCSRFKTHVGADKQMFTQAGWQAEKRRPSSSSRIRVICQKNGPGHKHNFWAKRLQRRAVPEPVKKLEREAVPELMKRLESWREIRSGEKYGPVKE